MRYTEIYVFWPLCQVMVGMAPFMSGSCQTRDVGLLVGNVYAVANSTRTAPMSVLGVLIELVADRLLPLRC